MYAVELAPLHTYATVMVMSAAANWNFSFDAGGSLSGGLCD